jgi:16S rRNA (guanine527-N7)-methyltransferase
LNNQNLIHNYFYISQSQETKLQKLIEELVVCNKHINLVGKSTLVDPWRSHILDCIQITPFIEKKNSSILDMGTGAGFPGLILAIMGYERVSVIDSNGKRIDFINNICKKLDIKASVFLNRIEKLNNKKFDFLTSRALAKLNKLLIYSHNFIHKDTVLIFLKGKTVNEEIKEARKYWRFKSKVQQSRSDNRGKILIVKNLAPKQ